MADAIEPLVMVWFGDDIDALEAEAIARIRQNLVSPPDDEFSLFQSFGAYSIARVLTGDLHYIGELDDALLVTDFFVNLGARVAQFWHEFYRARGARNRKRGDREPRLEDLTESFGDDAELVRRVWPLAGVLAKILERRNAGEQPDGEAEVKLWEEAHALCTLGRPNKAFFDPDHVIPGEAPELNGGLVGLIRRRVEALGRQYRWSTERIDDVAADVMSAVGAERLFERRLLAHQAGTGAEQFRRYLDAFIINYAKDKAERTLILSSIPTSGAASEVASSAVKSIPMSTVRAYKHKGQIDRHSTVADIERVQTENRARMTHRDPSHTTLRVSELAERWSCSERTLRAVVSAAEGALGPFPRDGAAYVIPDDPDLLADLKARLPKPRAPRASKAVLAPGASAPAVVSQRPRHRTPAQIAQQLGIPLKVVASAYSHLTVNQWGREPIGSATDASFARGRLAPDDAEELEMVLRERYADPAT